LLYQTTWVASRLMTKMWVVDHTISQLYYSSPKSQDNLRLLPWLNVAFVLLNRAHVIIVKSLTMYFHFQFNQTFLLAPLRHCFYCSSEVWSSC
jgi:hypothetical protein